MAPREWFEKLRAMEASLRDPILAVLLLVFALIGTQIRDTEASFRPASLLGAALIVAMTLPLAVRRRYPVPVLVVTGIATGLHAFTGERVTAGTLGVLFALYTVAAHMERREAVLSLVMTLIGICVSFAAYIVNLTASPFILVEQLGTNFIIFGVAWILGRIMRSRREYLRDLIERNRQLEAEREENARLAVADERARIARELHDIVAHHVSVITVQAAAARRSLESRGLLPPDDPARGALDAVESTGRETLAEMRGMLNLLRDDSPGDRAPQPGLARLDELLDQVRDAGLPVELVVEGAPRELPVGIDLSAYRIVQEALTNALRHAGRASAIVRLRYGPGDLAVEVVDDGRGAAAALLEPAHHGHGIIGMRERAGLVGGELEAGPRLSGGFAVTARLPLEPSTP